MERRMYQLSALFMAFWRTWLALVMRNAGITPLLSPVEQATLRALDFYTHRVEQLRGAIDEAVRFQSFYRHGRKLLPTETRSWPVTALSQNCVGATIYAKRWLLQAR